MDTETTHQPDVLVPDVPVPDAPDATPAKPKGKGGPKLGAVNAWRHGLRGVLFPKHLTHLKRDLNEFRRDLESAVLEKYGTIGVAHAALINSAYRAERHAVLAQVFFRREASKLSADDQLRYSSESVKASERRDKAIAALGLINADEFSF